MAHHPYDWKPAFLEALRNYPVLRHACEAAGIDPATAWRARKADEEFEEEVQAAMEYGIDRAELEAIKRAVDGWEEPVIDKGRLAYAYRRVVNEETGTESYEPVLDANGQPVPLTVKKRSDQLLQFVLKGRRRSTYGDKTEVTGAGGGPIATLDETAKAARIAALMAAAAARKDLA